MFLQRLIDFFRDITFVQGFIASLLATIVAGIAVFLWRRWKGKPKPPAAQNSIIIHTGPKSISPTAVGKDIHQDVKIDKSHRQGGGVYIERVESGATVNIYPIDYQDGVSQAEKGEVRKLFKEARAHYARGKFQEAIKDLAHCLDLEEDSEKLGALNLQIGNCYYEQQMYLKAAEFYAAGLGEARKAKDSQGEASSLSSIANTYMLRPASSGKMKGDNVQKAVEHYNKALKVFNKDEYPVQYATTQNNLGNAYTHLPAVTAEERAGNIKAAIECYRAALEIRKKDKYPVDYATTQNNLGTAYTYLPSATSEERARNVRAAIECYRAALEIYKKDEYPQYYCQTAENLGLVLAAINNPDACHWLKEAYALREYLGDQGKGLEEVIQQICKKEPE